MGKDDKYKNRYLKGKQYTQAAPIFGTATCFLTVGIISLVLMTIHLDFIGLSSWGYWMFIPAFFIFVGGFGQINANRKYKKVVLAALMDRGAGAFKLESIALEVGIKPSDLLNVLIDLRNDGKVSYRFDSESGNIIIGETITYTPSTEYVPPPKKIQTALVSEGKGYCVYCGQKLEEAAQFCPHCGSKI